MPKVLLLSVIAAVSFTISYSIDRCPGIERRQYGPAVLPYMLSCIMRIERFAPLRTAAKHMRRDRQANARPDMNALSKLTLLTALTVTPVVGHSRDANDNPTGPYVGGGIGQFNLNIEHLDDVDDAAQTVAKSDDNAWKVFAGYRFLPWLGVEAAYIDFGQPSDSFDATGSNGNYRVKVSGFAPSLIASVPLGPVELFGKVGQYYYNVDTHIDLDAPGPGIDSSHSGNDFLWGGGVALVLAKRVELRAEYEKVEIENAKDSDAFWLTGALRF